MTNLDEQIRNIIGQIPNYILEYLEISDGIKQDWADHQKAYLQLYSDKVQALIATQVREARINELGRLELRLCKSTQYGIPVVDLQSAIDDRIKELGE